ncbi:MAG: hypothetical protein ACO395_07945 [Pontimonas sp.]
MPFVSERFVTAIKDKKSSGTNDLYLNPGSLNDGETVRFSPVGDASLDFYECWGRNAEGRPKCLRFSEEPTPKELQDRANDEGVALVDQKGQPTRLKQALAFWVWNYTTSSVQLFQASQVSILETLGALLSDEDVSKEPGSWDFELTRTGTGMETRYTVVLKPGKRKGAVAAEVTAAWEECLSEGYNLQALLTGGDPTKSPF